MTMTDHTTGLPLWLNPDMIRADFTAEAAEVVASLRASLEVLRPTLAKAVQLHQEVSTVVRAATAGQDDSGDVWHAISVAVGGEALFDVLYDLISAAGGDGLAASAYETDDARLERAEVVCAVSE